MSVERDTSGDVAAEMTSGQTAYWIGRPFDPSATSAWRSGWLAAAHSAAHTLRERKALIKAASMLAAAVDDIRPAVNALASHKLTFRERQLHGRAEDALDRIAMAVTPAD